MAWYRCGSGGGGDTLQELLDACPAEMLSFLAAPAQTDNIGISNIGTGYKKAKAILSYYGPGAVPGGTLGGTLACKVKDNNNQWTTISFTKVSTVRNETNARALEYWEGDIDPTINITQCEFSASGYNYNAGTRVNANLWLLK